MLNVLLRYMYMVYVHNSACMWYTRCYICICPVGKWHMYKLCVVYAYIIYACRVYM